MRDQYADTIRLFVKAFPALTPELQKAARYMVENPEEIGLNSMRSVAKKAGVKPATISRLSKALGFEEYKDLREPFRQRLKRNELEFASRMQAMQRRGADNGGRLFAEFRDQEIDNVRRTLSDTNYSILLDAAESINNSRRVYVLGLRGAHAPAFLFHYAYQLFQDNSQFLDTGAGIFADTLRGLSDEDSLFVVSFAPYTQMTIDAVDYAAEAGAKIISVTDSLISPAANRATHTIVAQIRSASFYHSLTGALAVTQALIALLVAKAGGDAVKIAEDAEKQLSRISAYW